MSTDRAQLERIRDKLRRFDLSEIPEVGPVLEQIENDLQVAALEESLKPLPSKKESA